MPAAARPEKELDLLRVTTCGSVDDGKSTLLGRLFYDAGLVSDDDLAALARDSKGRPCGPEGLDFSLLVDGLLAEREQGITIDVAYRYFTTSARRYVFADAPGHEQYTRNMATAASRADAALLLVDARKGLLPQTGRHLGILALFGVRRIAIAVNKMDLVGFAEDRFLATVHSIAAQADRLALPDIACIPVAALPGDNVARRTDTMPWYAGPTVLEWLESMAGSERVTTAPFRMGVQWINRPHADFRGICGTVASGRVRVGDAIVVQPAARPARIRRVVAFEGDRGEATAGDAVTLVLDRDLDVARGDLLAAADAPPVIADQFAAHLVWIGTEPMIPGRSYRLRLGTATAQASVTALKYRLDELSQQRLAARTLNQNEIGYVNLAVDRALPVEKFGLSHDTGNFILVDPSSNETLAAGMIDFPLRRATNIARQTFDTDRMQRAASMGQQPAIVWLTGLSGAGKSTIANALERKLAAGGRHSYILDGDNLRHGLNKDLGFTTVDRVENIRRTAEVARLMADAGLIVIVALISPFRAERELARTIAGDIRFLEVFADAPLAACEARDPKGLYRKARAGAIANFTGIDSPYEPPKRPDLHLHTDRDTPDALAEEILAALVGH